MPDMVKTCVIAGATFAVTAGAMEIKNQIALRKERTRLKNVNVDTEKLNLAYEIIIQSVDTEMFQNVLPGYNPDNPSVTDDFLDLKLLIEAKIGVGKQSVFWSNALDKIELFLKPLKAVSF